MEDITLRVSAEKGGTPRQLEPQWNHGLIAASIGISLLGAFTSTQLMCHARTSAHFSGALMWTILGSLTFGFCSIWSLHEVAMLACELDLPIGLDVPLTILSSLLAVVFTFAALASDVLWDRRSRRNSISWRWRRSRTLSGNHRRADIIGEEGTEPFLRPYQLEDGEDGQCEEDPNLELPSQPSSARKLSLEYDENVEIGTNSPPKRPFSSQAALKLDRSSSLPNGGPSSSEIQIGLSLQGARPGIDTMIGGYANNDTDIANSFRRTSSDQTSSPRSSSFISSSTSTLGFGNIMSIKGYQQSKSSARNPFIITGKVLYNGSTARNLTKGFLWSLAITSMHYVGILALQIPQGYFALDPLIVVLSGTISWVVCSIGCICMAQMETHLTQQLLFSTVATGGVAAMHFTGMQAATFWSRAPRSEETGYPPSLAVAIASIAITTCIAANGLLVHSATLSRNKLAEIVHTKRKLWMAMAQKDNAEATAAARSDFIASASHEIRTPLHQLQGYSDLLARTELSEESRLLLLAIQQAVRTLSLITSNVLDWSRLEKDGEAVCRPTALDIRTLCESVVNLLPNKDDDMGKELLVVVAPEVPRSFWLDETYVHRILMNLLSNALKFTSSGYILLLIEMKDDKIIATVKDTGSGIPPSFLPQLFEPFKQAQTRGAQRGTGLGLSIIKTLLSKMEGNIEVQSNYQEAEDAEPGKSGTIFTVTIPVRSSPNALDEPQSTGVHSKIVIFHDGNERTLEGLCTAWQSSGFEVVIARKISDLAPPLKYIWADSPFLKRHPYILRELLDSDQYLVLVPSDTKTILHDIGGLSLPSHFLPISKPLVWHSIIESMAAAGQLSNKASRNKMVRFAPEVDVAKSESTDQETCSLLNDSIVKRPVILLVEDNEINQKLGTKMLTVLGYEVLLAKDGQEAVEQVIKHEYTIGAILMDQSMPRKDGLTATTEIREMEADGTLRGRRTIIAVSAVVGEQAQALCRSAGTDGFLAKPLSLRRLEETLKAVLG